MVSLGTPSTGWVTAAFQKNCLSIFSLNSMLIATFAWFFLNFSASASCKLYDIKYKLWVLGMKNGLEDT